MKESADFTWKDVAWRLEPYESDTTSLVWKDPLKFGK